MCSIIGGTIEEKLDLETAGRIITALLKKGYDGTRLCSIVDNKIINNIIVDKLDTKDADSYMQLLAGLINLPVGSRYMLFARATPETEEATKPGSLQPFLNAEETKLTLHHGLIKDYELLAKKYIGEDYEEFLPAAHAHVDSSIINADKRFFSSKGLIELTSTPELYKDILNNSFSIIEYDFTDESFYAMHNYIGLWLYMNKNTKIITNINTDIFQAIKLYIEPYKLFSLKKAG